MDELTVQIQTLIKEISQLGSGNSFVEKLLKEKIKEFETLTGIDTNDLLPYFNSVIEGCNLVIMNSGTVTFETSNGKNKTIPFAMNNTPIQHIEVPKNSSGIISITSLWIYKQDSAIEITNESFKGKNYIDKATKKFEIINQFEVNSTGDIQIFKGDVNKVVDQVKGEITTYFYIRDIEVDLEKNDNTISIGGGVYENKNSTMPESLKKFYPYRDFSKDIATHFSLVLELYKEKEIQSAPKEKELIFEKENQAILSGNQLRILYRWWKELNPKLKEQIKKGEAKIEIVGYTSSTGTDLYNQKLGKDRALDVKNLLVDIIGTDSEDKSIAEIFCSTEGELSERAERYVKLIIKRK